MYRQTDGLTDGLTNKLIWGGLGNLRFLQVNTVNCTTPWCNFHHDTSRPLPKERHCHPCQQDSPPSPRPLPTCPVPTHVSAGCVSCLRLCALPRKNLLFLASLHACQYPTVTATFHRGSSTRFDQDIRYVIIDVSLLCRCVATRGRGCRPPRIDFRWNTSTRHHNTLASIASPEAPITPPLVCGHLLIDGQHPKQVHCS